MRLRPLAAALGFAVAIVATGVAAAGEVRTHELAAGGGTRTWLAYEPAEMGTGELRPVVLVLHGPAQTPEALIGEFGWADVADRAGVLIVAPEAGPVDSTLPAQYLHNPRFWNEGRGDEPPAVRARDDVGFLLSVLDDAARRYPVDPRRVYAVGFGDGGGLVQRLAALHPERLAAAASVAGALPGDVRPAGPVPMLLIRGGGDPTLPLGGGAVVSPWRSGGTAAPIAATVDAWRAPLGCAEAPTNTWPAPAVQRLTWSCVGAGTGAGEKLVVVIVHDIGHRWPGGPDGPLPERIAGRRTDAFDATEAAWTFLSTHRR